MHGLVERPTLSREFMFPGTLASLPDAREAILDFVREQGADEQMQLDIFLALQEGLANAVLHGCRNDERKLVRCNVEITPSEFNFVIRDPGPGFPFTASIDADGHVSNLTEHGRGIQLMRSLMDDVSFAHNGSELRLKKLRPL